MLRARKEETGFDRAGGSNAVVTVGTKRFLWIEND